MGSNNWLTVDLVEDTERVLAKLGIPPMPISPLLVRTVEAHLRLAGEAELGR